MKLFRGALVLGLVACFACSACGAAVGDAKPRTVDSLVPMADRAASGAPGSVGRCPSIAVADLDGLVARAISGLEDTTAADRWSRECAWLTTSNGSPKPDLVTIEIGWHGSLHEYSAIPGASPIDDLADEAYALDNGARIALRSGEVVAVVSYAGASALTVEDVARQVAEQLEG